MKHIILAITIALCSTACNNSSKTKTVEAEQQKNTTERFDEASINEQDILTSLSKTTPFTEAEFKEAFPKSIGGLPLDDKFFSENQMANGTYGDGKIELQIIDCSEKHNGLQKTFLMAYNIKQFDDEDTKHENKERNGIKTISNYRIKSESCDIAFVYHNRWYVVLRGEGMSPDELWNTFDIDVMKKFKN